MQLTICRIWKTTSMLVLDVITNSIIKKMWEMLGRKTRCKGLAAKMSGKKVYCKVYNYNGLCWNSNCYMYNFFFFWPEIWNPTFYPKLCGNYCTFFFFFFFTKESLFCLGSLRAAMTKVALLVLIVVSFVLWDVAFPCENMTFEVWDGAL